MIVNNSKIKFDGMAVDQVMKALSDLALPDPFFSPFALRQIEALLHLLQAYSTTKQGLSLGAVSDSGSVYSVEWLTLLANNPETLDVVIGDLSAETSVAPVIDGLQAFIEMQESPETYTTVVLAINAILSELHVSPAESESLPQGGGLVVVPQNASEPQAPRNSLAGFAMVILATAVIAYCLLPFNGVSS
jgi:hypothetical protein